MEGARYRFHRRQAGDAARHPLAHGGVHRARLSGLRRGRAEADADPGAERRAARQHGGHPRRHPARRPVALFGRRVHGDAADDDRRHRHALPRAHAPHGARADRHDAQLVRAAAAARVRRDDGGRAVQRHAAGEGTVARLSRDGRRGAVDDAERSRAVRDRGAGVVRRPLVEGDLARDDPPHAHGGEERRRARRVPRARAGRCCSITAAATTDSTRRSTPSPRPDRGSS